MILYLLTNPLVICGVLAAGVIAALYLVLSTWIKMRRQEMSHLAETESLRESITALEKKVQEARAESHQEALPPAAYKPVTGLSAHNREEALRMYRSGGDQRAVSVALGLRPAEVALLEKVHQVVSGRATALTLDEAPGYSSEALSRYETSLPEA